MTERPFVSVVIETITARYVSVDSMVADMAPSLDAVHAQTYPAERTDRDDDKRRCLPNGEKDESDQRQRKISRRLHRTRPDRVIERCAKEADHRRVDTAHDRLRVRAPPKCFPERQCADEHEDARQEYGHQADRRAGDLDRRG